MGVNIVLSSPSGAGKTTITKKLSQKYPNIKISISHTTRKPRSNEIDGVDYYFVDKIKFQKLIEEGNFYEYAKIFDNYYGTSKALVKKLQDQNFDVVFDIDWQGTKKLSKFKELNLVKIFILPPNKTELKKRLNKRNQDSKIANDKRLMQYDNDILHWEDYDYIVINNDLEKCFSQIEQIIRNHKKDKMSYI
jgi:guanylate kinase|tara:strand:+ start:7240 stop:7815 length:576 start_codon:yes stop_codon:yes gene_type:complete